jgi:diacylglycerol O-acyltransferase
MQQLSSLDTHFLNQTLQQIAQVSIFEGELSLAELRNHVEARLPLLPPLRRRLVEVPFGIDEPWWIDDPDFDLGAHLHEATVHGELAQHVAEIAAQPVERARPLWELHLAHEPDRFALILKVHHAAVDGASAGAITASLFARAEAAPQPWAPEPAPTHGEMLMRGLAGMATRPLRMAQAQRRLLVAAGGGTAPPCAPRTFFNHALGAARACAFTDLSLADARAIKDAFGATVNDVVMATCAGALRRWLLARDALPMKPLVACVPISVRTEAERDAFFGNRVSLMLVQLATDVADPVERLYATKVAMDAGKRAHERFGDRVLEDVTLLTPRVVAGRMLPANLAVSNVAGSGDPLDLAGRRMLGHYPVSMLLEGQGLNITVLGYGGKLGAGLVSDPELVPGADLEELAGLLAGELAQLTCRAAPAQ